MLDFERHFLDNGLEIILHTDNSSSMAITNVLYKVGSKDENPSKTGFAHFFEHLMFSGSKNAPSYDEEIHMVGGKNNAFTSADLTNYYNILPHTSLETGIFLEADRMENLNINSKSFEIQQKVVIEEFKERYLNQPYGKTWHHIRENVYNKHGYAWPTIGKEISHIEQFTLDEVKDFYAKYYVPNNAILAVAGGINKEQTLELIKKHFGDIAPNENLNQNSPLKHNEIFKEFPNKVTVEEDVPISVIHLVFPIPERIHKDFVAIDLVTEILSNGKSSILFQTLVKEQEVALNISNYTSGAKEEGMFVISASARKGVSLEKLEKAIWEQLFLFIEKGPTERELNKAKTKVESGYEFGEVELSNRAFNLAYGDFLKKIEFFEEEKKHYATLSVFDIEVISKKLIKPENCFILYLKSKK